MDPLNPNYGFVMVKPIGKPEFAIRVENIYELNGPFQGNPPMVGILHAYGKKEEVLLHIHKNNYYDLKKILAGDSSLALDDDINVPAKAASVPDKPVMTLVE